MDLFALAAKITLDSDAYEKGLERAKGLWGGFTSVVKTGYAGLETGAKVFTTSSRAIISAMEGISKVGDAAIKTIGGVSAAAGASAAALGKLSLDQYADYEQLIGGVDTLFKEASWDVQMFAEDAYKTAGLSANEYMETVTSFSASLLQSLDGDTVEAAKKADMAILDMSDNANKMGSSIDTLQTAYAGFAKQQYMLLDNLKLGYGGTKEEMQRLLEDAQAISGIKYDISSYADVVDALHVIQTEMGITGTTAKEASSTISGSFASLKASAKNLLTAFASDEIPIDDVIKQTVDSLVTYGDNVVPRVEQILHNVKWVIEDYVDDLGGLFGNLSISVAQQAPKLIDEGFRLIDTMVSGLTQNSGAVRAAGESIIGALANGISSSISNLEPVSGDIIGMLATGVITYQGLALDVGAQVIGFVVNGIYDNLDEIEDSAVETVNSFIAKATAPEQLNSLGTKAAAILNAVGSGISKVAPNLYGAALDVVLAFGEGLVRENSIYELTTAAGNVVSGFIGGFTPERIDDIFDIGEEILGQFLDAVAGGNDTEGAQSKITNSATEIVTHLGNKMVEKAPEMTAKAGELIENFVGWFEEPANLESLDAAAAAVVDGVFALTNHTTESIKNWGLGVVGEIESYFEGKEVTDVIEDIFDFLGDAGSSKFVQSFKEGIGDFFNLIGIGSDFREKIWDDSITSTKNFIDNVKDWWNAGGDLDKISNIYTNDPKEVAPTITNGYVPTADELIELARIAKSGTPYPTSGKTVNVTQNIYSQAQSPSELMQEAIYRAEEAVLFGP